MIGSVRVGVRARRASEGASGDAAEGLAGAPGVEESHGEGQGDEGGEERRFGGDGDATDGEEADEPGQLHARAGGHDGAVLPGCVQGCVGLGEDDEVFVAVPFAVPAAGHDEEYGEEHEEDETSSEDEGQCEAASVSSIVSGMEESSTMATMALTETIRRMVTTSIAMLTRPCVR